MKTTLKLVTENLEELDPRSTENFLFFMDRSVDDLSPYSSQLDLILKHLVKEEYVSKGDVKDLQLLLSLIYRKQQNQDTAHTVDTLALLSQIEEVVTTHFLKQDSSASAQLPPPQLLELCLEYCYKLSLCRLSPDSPVWKMLEARVMKDAGSLD